MSVQVHTAQRLPKALRTEWVELWQQRIANSVFCQPDWLEHWTQTLGSDETPYLVVLRDRERLTTIAPLSRSRQGAWGDILKAAGHGVSDYTDWLEPDPSASASSPLDEIAGHLAGDPTWTGLELTGRGDRGQTDRLQMALRQAGLITRRYPGLPCPFMAMPDGFDAIWSALGSRGRYNIRSREKRLAAFGPLEYVHATRDTAPALLESAIRLHARRWHGQHTSTVFSSSAEGRGFYRAALPALIENGSCDLAAITLNAEPIASAIGFMRGPRYHYYLPAWEPSYATYAPSTLLLVHLMRFASQHGARELDFMLGDEEYKRAWATGSRNVETLLAAPSTARGQAWLRWRAMTMSVRDRARNVSVIRSIRRYGLSGWRRPS